MDKFDEYLIHISGSKEITHTYIRTDNPSPETKGPFTFKFEPRKYKDLYLPLEQALMTDAPDRGIYDEAVEALGMFLFSVMFPEELKGFFHKCLKECLGHSDGSKALRIRLAVEDADIANVNWELVYDDDDEHIFGGGRYLSTYPQTSFTRFFGEIKDLLEFVKDKDRREKKFNARTLFVTSNPTGDTNLDPEGEIGNMLKELENHSKGVVLQHSLDASPLYRSNWHRIYQQINKREAYDIIHFYCHGTFREGKVNLIMVDDNNERTYIAPDSFSQLFDEKGTKSISFVYVNACKGALSSRESIQGLVQNIVSRNSMRIPAVLAMQSIISIKAAYKIAVELYKQIYEGKPVDVAVQNIRRFLANSGDILYDRMSPSLPAISAQEVGYDDMRKIAW